MRRQANLPFQRTQEGAVWMANIAHQLVNPGDMVSSLQLDLVGHSQLKCLEPALKAV